MYCDPVGLASGKVEKNAWAHQSKSQGEEKQEDTGEVMK